MRYGEVCGPNELDYIIALCLLILFIFQKGEAQIELLWNNSVKNVPGREQLTRRDTGVYVL